MSAKILTTTLLPALAGLVLSCLAAGPLAAANPDAEDVELRVLPEQPYDTDSVRLNFQIVLPSPCFSVIEVFVRTDNIFELSLGSCPILPPPGPAAINETVDVGRLEPGTYEVRYLFEGSLIEAITFTVREAKGTCAPGADVLCLGDRRFRVESTWQANGQSGAGQAAAITRDTGRFSFFEAGNVELVVKVIDGCATNDHFWVFAGGLTNVRTSLTVTDTTNDATRTYDNPAGTPFAPLQDTAAFDCP
ncbi:MAG TPA: hypothetical protein VEG34_09175 [Thermoanaerobaculia bacterium]|nr:hypothetical protein [Thermoanaerobaculia bacterium]